MTHLSLYDPGMVSKKVEYDSPEAAIQALQSGLYPHYTDANIVTDGRTTHVASREVGEKLWTVKACRP